MTAGVVGEVAAAADLVAASGGHPFTRTDLSFGLILPGCT